jgi:hypothetical protein
MGLGERCDAIVRLIDETLADLGIDPLDGPADISTPSATVTPLAPAPGSARRVRASRAGQPRPDRAAVGC